MRLNSTSIFTMLQEGAKINQIVSCYCNSSYLPELGRNCGYLQEGDIVVISKDRVYSVMITFV